MLNQVVCFGGLAFLAPVAPGFIRQEFAACFEVCGIGCALRHGGLTDARYRACPSAARCALLSVCMVDFHVGFRLVECLLYVCCVVC
jgi:hypothetical protein